MCKYWCICSDLLLWSVW